MLGCVFGFLFPNALLASEKPNIIFFLVDDMGWMDCSVYGSKYYETPNIDRLAAMGKVFTSAYTASPLCSPPVPVFDRQVSGTVRTHYSCRTSAAES